MPDLIDISGGRSHVGAQRAEIAHDGEAPQRPVRLKPFRIAPTTVTNQQFTEFVAASGYVSEAECIGNGAVFRGLLQNPSMEAPSNSAFPWWAVVEGATWRTPEGPGSTIEGREDHPVVQVSHRDALAFCAWVGARLPNEAEWEHAARGGLGDPRFPWGDEEPDDEQIYCNIWQGAFPAQNTERDGYYGCAPARSFAPNGYGLYNMVGNVWEWTADPFRIRSVRRQAKSRNAQAKAGKEYLLKGGSFLCHVSYCYRYRIAARHALEVSSATSNVGFRIAS